MRIDWLVLIPLVVGHLALFVLALNLLHSTAVPEKLLDVLNLALLFATLAALPLMLTQGHWTGWPAPARGYALVCLGVAQVGLPWSPSSGPPGGSRPGSRPGPRTSAGTSPAGSSARARTTGS